MLVPTADLWVPPPPRRAVLRASVVTAAAVAATFLTHGVFPILRTGTRPMDAQACHAFSLSADPQLLALAVTP